jgi:hypothetical protein
MNYILISNVGQSSSETRSYQFTQELYKISRPNPNTKDVTTSWFGVVKHPITGQCALQIPDLNSDDTYVSPQVNLNRLRALLNPSLADPGEVDNIVAQVNIKKGSRIKFFDLLPAYAKNNIRTQAEMDADGWFPPVTMP